MTTRCILVVEDDAAIRRGVVDALRYNGYDVQQAGNGVDGMRLATKLNFDLLLLDLVLPGASGYEILEAARKTNATVPVILLTARGEEADRVRGLKLGADDYVVKPFSYRELLARVEAVLRRSPERPHPVSVLPLPSGQADLERREVRFADGTRQDLSEKEADLLRYLASNSGRAISREELLRRVWKLEPEKYETRTIDVHVASLRAKLRDDGEAHSIIETVRGKGYCFMDDRSASRDAAD
ncbi:MAG: response regulator transcription factor [Verrucomicrobiales bacterium]|nr:response regulator transcription factor [Verrucomicrobiales bacterium]